MPLLESLYRPTRKDVLSGLSQRRWVERLYNAAAAATVTAQSSTVPPDTIRVVEALSMYVQGGGGLVMNYAKVYAMIAGSGIEVATWQLGWIAAGNFTLDTVNPHLVLLPGEYLNAEINFPGVAAHTIACGAVGYELPRGNLQR